MADTDITPEAPVTSTEPEAAEPEPVKPAAPTPKPRAKAKAAPAAEPQADDTPAQPAPPAPEDPLKIALRDVQSRYDDLSVKFRDRDSAASKLEREVKSLREQVETFGKREREGAIVTALRDGDLKHLSVFEIRSALAGLHEASKIDRYSDKPEETAKAALEALKTAAPNLLRVPTPQSGGPAGAPPQLAQPRGNRRGGPGI